MILRVHPKYFILFLNLIRIDFFLTGAIFFF